MDLFEIFCGKISEHVAGLIIHERTDFVVLLQLFSLVDENFNTNFRIFCIRSSDKLNEP